MAKQSHKEVGADFETTSEERKLAYVLNNDTIKSWADRLLGIAGRMLTPKHAEAITKTWVENLKSVDMKIDPASGESHLHIEFKD